MHQFRLFLDSFAIFGGQNFIKNMIFGFKKSISFFGIDAKYFSKNIQKENNIYF